MKLTFCYSTFNGLELLEKSVENILPVVDHVVICHQVISNKGNGQPKGNNEILLRLDKIDKVKIILFHPYEKLTTKRNEIQKHNLMIKCARELGSTHFIMGACDHFYSRDEVKFAKNFVLENDIDVSLTAMHTYYKTPQMRLEPIEDYFMPFICKLGENTGVENRKYPYKVDPSVAVFPYKKMHMFRPDEVLLHHYSMLRHDVLDKFTNAAASIRWNPDQVLKFIDEYENAKLGDKISYFQGRKLVSAPALFFDTL